MRLRTVFLRMLLWLTIEVLLTLIGLDNLADYSEFVFQDRGRLLATQTEILPIPAT